MCLYVFVLGCVMCTCVYVIACGCLGFYDFALGRVCLRVVVCVYIKLHVFVVARMCWYVFDRVSMCLSWLCAAIRVCMCPHVLCMCL